MNDRSRSIALPTASPCTMSPARAEHSTRSCTSVSIRADAGRAQHGQLLLRQLVGPEDACAQRVVDVVVDVGDPVDEPHDLALQRRRLPRAARVAQDPVAHRIGQVEALEHVDDPQRVLVVAEAAPEALAPGGVEHRLADVPEGRMAEIVAEPDRLREVLVEPQRPRDRARDLRRLERVREPRAVVVALRRDEHLRLVLEPAERLAVHDPVAVALERRAERAVGLGPGPRGRIGAMRERATARRPPTRGCGPRTPRRSPARSRLHSDAPSGRSGPPLRSQNTFRLPPSGRSRRWA